MQKKILTIIIFMLLIAIAVIPASGKLFDYQQSVVLSNNNILYVGGIGPNNYTSIQDAIDDSNNGDTVFVYDDSSPYFENIFVNKSINLFGESKETTVIDGGGNDDVVNIFADQVKMNGFTIQHSSQGFGYEAGINMESDYSIITDNIIANNCWCADIRDSNHNVISNNIIENNLHGGIHLVRSHYNTISNCIISNNGMRGIILFNSNENTISSNTFIQGGLNVFGSSHNSVIDNTVNGKPLVYLEEEYDKIVDDAGQVVLVNCIGITVQNQEFTNVSIGVQVRDSTECLISGNTFFETYHGASIADSSKILVENNVFQNNWYTGLGVYRDEGGTRILNNTIVDNEDGLYIFNCRFGVNIKNNFISGNDNGILIHSHSQLCTLSENVISSNNKYGINIRFSDSNMFFMNNFENNGVHAYFVYYRDIGRNKWSLGLKGNYWDDWGGFGPKIIQGIQYFTLGTDDDITIPWINIDWRPAREPYDL